MVRIIKTEFYKLKRYHILWAGVALMLLSVLLTLFTSMARQLQGIGVRCAIGVLVNAHKRQLHFWGRKWLINTL